MIWPGGSLRDSNSSVETRAHLRVGVFEPAEKPLDKLGTRSSRSITVQIARPPPNRLASLSRCTGPHCRDKGPLGGWAEEEAKNAGDQRFNLSDQ